MRTRPVDKADTSPYRDMKRIFEKSVVAARDLPAGHVITEADLAYKKPGDGNCGLPLSGTRGTQAQARRFRRPSIRLRDLS
jgi:sialic acid synthase SpsE